jgi:vesicle coat complex subunit
MQVVANAVATLSEITNNGDHDVLQLNAGLVQKLLAALNECTEWGQARAADSRQTVFALCCFTGSWAPHLAAIRPMSHV